MKISQLGWVICYSFLLNRKVSDEALSCMYHTHPTSTLINLHIHFFLQEQSQLPATLLLAQHKVRAAQLETEIEQQKQVVKPTNLFSTGIHMVSVATWAFILFNPGPYKQTQSNSLFKSKTSGAT